MSMSQEEIEALMNGLDIEDDDKKESSNKVKVNTQEIEELLSQTEEIKENIKLKDEVDLEIDNSNDKSIDSFLNNNDIENLLSEINSVDSKNNDDFFDEIIEKKEEEKKSSESSTKIDFEEVRRTDDEIAKDWTSSKISEGVFPLPAEKDTKVVNQLSQVANDSEEKVSQIFDVLSLTLDNNNELRGHIKDIESFLISQSNLLVSLNNKFPNIKIFDEHLSKANKISSTINNSRTILNDEDNHIFQAMELMQFNDINRQKIERVMSVIRKLSLYLNNLFEDDGTSKDVAVAKHIHGDSTNDLIGDDLDKLISEFSKN